MKTIVVLSVLLALITAIAFGQQDKGDGWEYLAVKVPAAETLQTEFKGRSKVDARIKKRTDIDSLGEDGWELVSVVPESGSYVCFSSAAGDAAHRTRESRRQAEAEPERFPPSSMTPIHPPGACVSPAPRTAA
jgi:hypothetical protein